ncbi:hypothetical protein HU200_034464 [Digitaria exilis]|uniref:Uncharacterized protein n=1 Tax=Digitaria exilis TaxID=1010633 RepID=A0A835BHJ0_9POAL|nr:hypothetical protein HU200_034464 [Digitaria exilis]
MVSGASGFRAAVAAVAIFAVLVMSSQGHPKKSLCSDCPSLCSANCTAVIAEKCSNECSYQYDCDQCKAQVLQSCCKSFCSHFSDGTGSFSCCPNGTSSVTCSCEYCDSPVQNSCTSACSPLTCMACTDGIGQQCIPPCMSDCNDHCVKKDG